MTSIFRTPLLWLFLVGISILFTATVQAIPAAVTEPENATYSGIYENAITLDEGLWEGEPFVAGGASRQRVGLIEDFSFSGDLNDSGEEEQVVFLWENSGGSGTRTYLSILSSDNGKLVNLSTTLIGDRVQLRSGQIKNEKIELNVIQHQPGEPACCPSQKATLILVLDGTTIHQEKMLLAGNLSLSDLEETEWYLSSIKRGEVLSDKQEITLRFDGDKIVGKSACNRYFAGIKELEDMAGNISIGQIGSTRMICPQESMDLENRYFAALQGVFKYSFVGGKLALSWKNGDILGTMLFKPRKLQSQ